jgi:CBS domain-containing protein
MLDAIRAARADVFLEVYAFSPEGVGAAFIAELSACARRGVRVKPAARRLYRRLLAAGVEIAEWTGSVLHAKAAVVDGERLLVGSCLAGDSPYDSAVGAAPLAACAGKVGGRGIVAQLLNASQLMSRTMPREESPMETATVNASERLLEVRTVDVIIGRGRSLTLSSVRCPVRAQSAAVEECAHCRESGGLAQDALARGEYLWCRVSVPAPRPGAGPAERAIVGEVMRRTAVALRPGLARAVAADALRARGADTAPVVDGEGRPIGIVSEADLLRARPGAKVSDAMARVALAVLETAPLARAASLMAAHGADRLPVVSDDGIVVGVLTAMDVVVWLAGHGGPLSASDAPGALPV